MYPCTTLPDHLVSFIQFCHLTTVKDELTLNNMAMMAYSLFPSPETSVNARIMYYDILKAPDQA